MLALETPSKKKQMKNLSIYTLIFALCLSFAACSSDDDSTPEIVNEEEVITTV
jgi:hypothetical protein